MMATKESVLSTIPVESVDIANQGDVKFSDVPLESLEKGKKKKVPRRIIHFSDGIVEEYSTDEEEEVVKEPEVNPKELTWFPWFWYYTVFSATKTLAGIDFCGEKLAWFLGITSPKYQSAINEYYRLKEEEESEKRSLEQQEEIELQEITKDLEKVEGGGGDDEISTIKLETDKVETECEHKELLS